MQFHLLKIKNIQRETADTLTITFDVPSDLKADFAYEAGQYLTLRFLLGGKEERRAYSMSSAPFEGKLCVTVKRLAGGKVSNHIHDQLKVGDSVEVSPPNGRFTLPFDDTNRKSYFFFGAGSGITPLLSLIKTALEEEPQSSIFLFYGSRDEENIIFKDELAELAERHEGQFALEYILSQPLRQKPKGFAGMFSKGKTNWKGLVGRIDRKHAADFLENWPARYPRAEYCICGPGNLPTTVEQVLVARGVAPNNIHIEHFSAPELSASDAGTNSTTNATIQLEGKTLQIAIPAGKTILQALLDAGYEAPYSCQAGSCSTCMAKVTKGKAQMDVCYALDPDEVADGYILTCRAQPQGDEIELTYD
jgi:ring-1,2-phenylacetyl-CoA epoxidase subunit PaaE